MLIFFLFIFAPDLHDISYMTKIVVASDSFKGSLSSAETAQAISAGINDAYPGCSVRSLILGDGGEGTAESIAAILGGRWTTIEVNDPVGRRIKARYAICEEDMTAIIDLAEASGLTLIEDNARNPLHTSTYGTGEMIMDAVRRGCRHVIIGLGGSATNDGGTGMLEALEFRFLDADGKTIERCCGNNLCDIVSIDTSDVPDELLASSFTAACDVGTVFCGEEGATRVFAPQKGACENEIELLEKGMVSLCEVIRRQTGKDLCDGLFRQSERSPVQIQTGRGIVCHQDFCLKIIFFCQFCQQLYAFVHFLMGDEAEICRYISLLRNHIIPIGAFLHGKSDGSLEHSCCLWRNQRQYFFQ